MQPHRPKHPLSSLNSVPRLSATYVANAKLSMSDLSQGHTTSGACSCPFCMWTTGTRWSNTLSKTSNAGSQTDRHSDAPTFFEDDPRKMTAAMLHNIKRTMRPCFFEWLTVVEVNLKVKRRQQVTLKRWAKQSAYVTLKGWMEVLSWKKELKQKGARVIGMLTNAGLVSSMEKWKSEAKKSKGSKQILEKVIMNMSKMQLRKALHGWSYKVDLVIARKELLRKVAEIWWGNLFKKYFELWAEKTRTDVELRHQTATEGIPPAWKPPRHIYTLHISASILNMVSDGIGKVGLTCCGLNTTSEICYLDFEGARTAKCTLSSYTHLGKIAQIVLEHADQKLCLSRVDILDETLGVSYLFLEPEQNKQAESTAPSGVIKAVGKFRRKAANGDESGDSHLRNSGFGQLQKQKIPPTGEPSIIADPRPPPIVKKVSYTFESPSQLRVKIQIIEKWLRRSVVDVKLLHVSTSTNLKAVDFYVEYMPSDTVMVTGAMAKILSYTRRHSSRSFLVQARASARYLTFLSLVALQRRRFQSYCLQLNFLWSRISSHYIRAQYIQSWKASFSLLNYLRVRSTPIVLARNQRAANVVLRGLKRLRSIMYYRKWLKWKSCLQSRMLALLPRQKLKFVMYFKRLCLAKLGAYQKQFQSLKTAATFLARAINADVASKRIQRMYLLGLACARLIQSYIRVQFQKKVRARVFRLLHEREQQAFHELQKMTELKNMLEQCHSPEPSAAYWRKYGKTENPDDRKQMNLSWASMESIVRKTTIPVPQDALVLQEFTHDDLPSGQDTVANQDSNLHREDVHSKTTSDNVDTEISAVANLQNAHVLGRHLGLSPFLRRIEEANIRATELRKEGYDGILKLQRSVHGFQSRQLVQQMKLGNRSGSSPERSLFGSENINLPKIRATFRQLRNGESPEVVDWTIPMRSVFEPPMNKYVWDQKRVPNPPSTLTRNSEAFKSLRSIRLAAKNSDSAKK
jgi:hypothetical protein